MNEDLTPDEPQLHEMLRALRASGHPEELAGEKNAVAAFTAVAKEKEKAAMAKEKERSRSARHAFRGAKLAAAAMAGSLVMGGVAAAAVTGSLPGPFQDVAHTFGAPGASADGTASGDPSESGDPSGSPSASGTHKSDADHHGHGPSAFAVCWYVVHKTNGAAGGPWSVHPTAVPSATPSTQPSGDGSDPSDAWDHGKGAWSTSYANIKAAAAAAGQSVLDYCTTLLSTGHPDGHHKPGKGKSNGQGGDDKGDKGDKGSHGHGQPGDNKGHHGSDDGSGHGHGGSSGGDSGGDSGGRSGGDSGGSSGGDGGSSSGSGH